MTWHEALSDPAAAARLIRAAARNYGTEDVLDELLAMIPSAGVARRLASTKRTQKLLRQAAVVWLGEHGDLAAN